MCTYEFIPIQVDFLIINLLIVDHICNQKYGMQFKYTYIINEVQI